MNHKRKRIVARKPGEAPKYYENASEAALYEGISVSRICQRCNANETIDGWTWGYEHFSRRFS